MSLRQEFVDRAVQKVLQILLSTNGHQPFPAASLSLSPEQVVMLARDLEALIAALDL